MSVEFCKTEEKTVLCASEVRRALVVAAAGRHNILFVGRPGSGKTRYANYMRLLTPNPTKSELESVNRIHSLAGIMPPDGVKESPFRSPHQTATIEGMCGGGVNCHPGEISLAHNGILFLDDAAEFRTSVLQMLRVPMEMQNITLSRAGRSTIFPADFQLVMATNPCPCGNFGSESKLCLCSARSIEMYWKKFSAPLLDRVEIIVQVGDNDEVHEYSLDKMREEIEVAIETQRELGTMNSRIKPGYFPAIPKETEDDIKAFITEHLSETSQRGLFNFRKVALTIADLEDKDVCVEHFMEAVKLRKPVIF